MYPYAILALTAFVLLFIIIRVLRLLEHLFAMAVDLFDHTHTRMLAEMAVATVITSARNGEHPGDWSDPKTIERITCRLNDILLLNGYDVSRWDPKSLIYAALGQTDLGTRLNIAVHQTRSPSPCPDSTSEPSPTVPLDSPSADQ